MIFGCPLDNLRTIVWLSAAFVFLGGEKTGKILNADSMLMPSSQTNLVVISILIAANMEKATTQYMQAVTSLQTMIDDLDGLADPVTIAMINERLMYMEKAFVMDGVSGTDR